MAETILVTGGAGFIGSHLSERLIENGHKVVCLDNFNDYYKPAVKWDNISGLRQHTDYTLVEADILDVERLRRLFTEHEFDVVVHLAARAGVRPSIRQPLLYQKVNVEGTTNLLEMMREFRAGKFIFGSSSSVYGENLKVPFSEDDPVDHPISPYAATKKACELICYTYYHLYEIPITCLRFFTVYGPRQRPDMAIHKFARAIDSLDEITMYGDGKSRRDYTYITDIVDGICKSIEHCRRYHVYNLGESQTIDLLSLIHLIAKNLGKEPKIQRLPRQPGDVPITYADITRARNEIAYQPSVTIEQGIAKFTDWYKNNGVRQA